MELREHDRLRAMYDALQIANIADLYLKTINTRLTITYLETWSGSNLFMLNKHQPISNSLKLFSDHIQQHHINDPKDTSHIITGEKFESGESGMGVMNSICTTKSAGISADLNMYEPHLVASTMTHMIGHNLHMNHDEGRDCQCQDWYGCLMSRNVVGKDHVQPSKFSKCSQDDYYKALQGNPTLNCILKNHKAHSSGYKQPLPNPLGRNHPWPHKPSPPLRAKGFPCRKSMSECDIPEVCDGLHGTCPIDIYKKTGSQCEGDKGYCFRGRCPTRDTQCNHIWGSDGKSSNESCYNKLNTQGVFTGNCGKYRNGSFIKCALENAKCGKLFCQNGRPAPIVSSPNTSYFKAAFNIHGRELECKVLNYDDSGHDDDWSLTHDGTACGKNLVCINQTCTSIYVYIEPGHCMTNNSMMECSGHGVCSNINTCYCNSGWTGEDCSSYDKSLHYMTTAPPHHGHTTASSAQTADEKKNTTLDRNIHIVGQQGSDTVFLVVVLVSGVGSVFFVFAFMALCYRRKSTLPKYDPPYVKRPIVKKPPQQHLNPATGKTTEETNLDQGNRLISFGPMPSYSTRSSVIGAPPPPPGMDMCREHKLPAMKRGPSGCPGDEETMQSVDDDMMSFMDVSGNSIGKIPEKGILKKSYGLLTPGEKEKWSEESQSDNNDVLSQCDQNQGDTECQVSEVERTLKSLNGYHEDIIDALKRAASHRSMTGAASLSSDEISTAQHVPYPRFATPDLTRLKSSHEKLVVDSGGEDDDHPPHTIRIRNLEDIIRQLEHHPSRHMSPSGSEEIRMSEPEADRHYRRSRGDSTGSLGFVYGRYRQPTSSSGASGSTSGGRGSDTRLVPSNAGVLEYSDGGESQGAYTEEDDLDRPDAGEQADSESDEFVVLPSGVAAHPNDAFFWTASK
ncbi:EGF-like domain extracellular [Trinorchestia longiramus]|nr:EGF-like domain extracellular [Trinorchestia longiramus]